MVRLVSGTARNVSSLPTKTLTASRSSLTTSGLSDEIRSGASSAASVVVSVGIAGTTGALVKSASLTFAGSIASPAAGSILANEETPFDFGPMTEIMPVALNNARAKTPQ